MSYFFSSIVVLFLCVSMTACRPDIKHEPSQGIGVTEKKKGLLQDRETVKRRLYQQFNQWKGTRYKLGGLDKRGIDCSGFVYVTYLEKFGINLPRSTQFQSNIGKGIKLNKLRSGDLVFFKTGWKSKHVGIYIENNKFMHVSKKRGVMISRLDERYWNSKYWRARRVSF